MNRRAIQIVMAVFFIAVVTGVIVPGSSEIDLKLSASASADTLQIRDVVTVTLTVTNLDQNQPATGLFLGLYNLGDLVVVMDNRCKSLGTVTWRCDLSDLPPGQSQVVKYEIRVEFQALLTGVQRLHQYVASSQTDSNIDNNLVDVNINVADR